MEPRKIVASLAVKHRGNWAKIYDDLAKKEFDEPRVIEKILKTIRCNYITICDKLWKTVS